MQRLRPELVGERFLEKIDVVGGSHGAGCTNYQEIKECSDYSIGTISPIITSFYDKRYF
jgi:hypothetical protein